MFKTIITDHPSYDAIMIREEVFVKEQKFKNEFDEIDAYARHLVIYDDGAPIGCCRFFKLSDNNEYVIGRVAVLSEYRGRRIGEKIMSEAEKELKKLGAVKLYLSAQTRALNFYIKQGFTPTGNAYLDEYCKHIKMEKSLV